MSEEFSCLSVATKVPCFAVCHYTSFILLSVFASVLWKWSPGWHREKNLRRQCRWRQDKDLAVFTSGRVSWLLQRCWWARNTNWWWNNFFHATTAAFFQSVQGGFNSISIVLDSLFVPRNWMSYLWLESVWNYGASPRGDKRFWKSQFQWLVSRVGWKLSFHLSTLFFYLFFC